MDRQIEPQNQRPNDPNSEDLDVSGSSRVPAEPMIPGDDTAPAKEALASQHGHPHPIDTPVLSGSHMSPDEEAHVANPYRGEADPAAMDHQPALRTTTSLRWVYAAGLAAAIWLIVHTYLLQFATVLPTIAVAFVLVALVAMVALRMSHLHQRRKLHLQMILLWSIWLVPLALALALVVFLGNTVEVVT